MAGRGGVARLFERHRSRLLKELDINRIFPKLARKGVFTAVEETEISSITDNIKKLEVFLDLLSVKGTKAFQEFCSSLEELSPNLLTSFLLETSEVDDDDKPSQALQLGFELALKDRDAVLREKAKATEERDNAIRQLQQVKSERDQAITSLENLTGKPAKLSNTKRFEDSPILGARSGSPNHKNRVMESDGEVEESGDNVVWETHKVHLTKAPVFGFGIAVSGGVDSPHFANGDPSVAISDVLRAGPAEGRLQVNDRIVSVNSISLENVDHARAIQVLRDCGTAVHLVIRRRVVLPSILDSDTPPLKVTLSKKSKKDDFGVILGCRFYIKDIPGHSLAAQEGGLKVGDTVLKINNTTTENLSLIEARKLLEKGSKDKLQLIVAKHKNISHKKQNSQPKDDALPYQPGFDTLRRQLDKDDVNIYRPSVRSEDDLFKPESLPQGVPLGAYPQSEHTRYDGRYVYDHEGPPRPPLPTGFDDGPALPQSPGQGRLNPEDYYQQYPGNNNYSPHDSRLRDYNTRPIVDDDVFNTSHEERYVGKRHDIRPEPRSVTFRKDADVGLGLRLAGGNSTGTFIASVQPGCAAEAQGLTEGDQIVKAWLTEHGVKANEREVSGMTREEAVNYLTSLQGEVTLVVQYKKEEYDRIMASHEAGDSFYIKTHFHYEGTANGEHSFVIGDLFHIKDTLFRGIGGSWLAIKLDKNFQETKKGTIPNTHKAETICQYQQQQNNDKENFPNKGRGSLFRRKAARRAKSLGKDHWEELIFSGLHTKFTAYQRVVLREAGFVRPVVIFGAISDIARERLISTYPERFEAPESESSSEDSKKKSGIIRLGSIRNIINKRKHCVIDVTPHHVDRLNYAQYCPIVIYIKADNKQAIKDCRAKWKTSSKNPKKLLEHNEKLERFYSHLFTGVINHNSSDNWFPKVMEMVEAQNHQKIWMSEKKPEDDINDDFLFPMPNRMSFAGSPDSELDLSRNTGDQSGKPRLMRSSSDPSINTNDHIPGIPPYPTPPNYNHKKGYGERIPYNDDPRYDDPYSHVNGRPEDHYYPSYYADHAQNRSHIDHYATLTPSERLRHRSVEVNPGVNDYSPYKTRVSSSDLYRSEIPEYATVQKHTLPHISQSSVPPTSNQKSGHNDSSSHSSDSYNRYVSSPSNKHDDSKLRDKFGSLVVSGQPEKGLAHDPYRFTRSTTNPVSSAHVDKAKLSDLSAKYRKDDPKSKKPVKYMDAPVIDVPPKVKKEPPPVPVKNYSLRERGVVFEDEKARNYENSNRSYTDMNYSSQARRDRPNYNGADNELHRSVDNTPEGPYEYVALKQPNGHVRDLRQNGVNREKRPSDNHVDVYNNHVNSYDNQIYGTEYFPDNVYDRTGKSFANHMYMDHRDLDRIRSSKEQLRNDSEIYPVENGYTRPRTDDEQLQELNQFRHRAKSESHTRTNKPTLSNPRSDRYKSWDPDKHVREHFESYKKLITPGFYGSKKQFLHSHSDLREGEKDAQDKRNSAFEAYRKQEPLRTFGKKEPPQSVKAVDVTDSTPFKPVPTPPPPPPIKFDNVYRPSPLVTSLLVTKELYVRDNDSCDGASDSISTPDTVIAGMDFGREIDENHTVVATARGSFDSGGGVLESKETGVSIIIPPGAIPDGPKQEIYFKVCRDNSILPPLDRDKGETLLSPLVMCGPHGLKFNQPVELKLPHCAAVNPDSWSFALKSSDSPSGHPTQWQNMNLAGLDGVTQGHVGKNSVSVMVDHF
ncbi:tight junction protein ZO-1 isoform X3 [Patella vulgata]|uniref:tight junction protein ZO-1 isoform X3 n=1 Tax=Patella vulgata TaxID=6465 RepID=UPI0024A80A4D|nr:tight junction protein ZO-1 isoform X3 [Patella vulgata]